MKKLSHIPATVTVISCAMLPRATVDIPALGDEDLSSDCDHIFDPPLDGLANRSGSQLQPKTIVLTVYKLRRASGNDEGLLYGGLRR